MKSLTRRSFVLTAAGGLGALATSRSHAAQTGVPAEKAGAARAGQPGRNTTTTVRAASASVKLTDDNMQELHAKEKVFQPAVGGRVSGQRAGSGRATADLFGVARTRCSYRCV